MPVVRGIVVGLVGAALVLALTAYRPAPVDEASLASVTQTLSTASGSPTLQPSSDVVWGKVPYCDCFALSTSATTNVAAALQEANLTVSLKELSPRDGWLYFVVSYDAKTTTADEVGVAMVAGGAEVLDGPP